MGRNFEYIRIAAGTGIQILDASGISAATSVPEMSNGTRAKRCVSINYRGDRTNRIVFEPSNSGVNVPSPGEGHALGFFQDASYATLNTMGSRRMKWRETGDNTTSFTFYPLEDY